MSWGFSSIQRLGTLAYPIIPAMGSALSYTGQCIGSAVTSLANLGSYYVFPQRSPVQAGRASPVASSMDFSVTGQTRRAQQATIKTAAHSQQVLRARQKCIRELLAAQEELDQSFKRVTALSNELLKAKSHLQQFMQSPTITKEHKAKYKPLQTAKIEALEQSHQEASAIYESVRLRLVALSNSLRG